MSQWDEQVIGNDRELCACVTAASNSVIHITSIKGNMQMFTAMMGEIHTDLQTILTHDHAMFPAPAAAPMAAVPTPAAAPAVTPAPVIPTPVLVAVPAITEAQGGMDIQVMITVAFTAAHSGKWEHKDDDVNKDARNVRHHSAPTYAAAPAPTYAPVPTYAALSTVTYAAAAPMPTYVAATAPAPSYTAAGPAPSYATAPPAPSYTTTMPAAVPEASSAPARRANNPVHEFIFGPVKWKLNISAKHAGVWSSVIARPNA
ncbi:hypothetical protein DFH09DRAFT_1102293 [Mycena vulgaris]|nr:hypothetical protein DFH09DRAFT_1102293 [Mycena vulgaris]